MAIVSSKNLINSKIGGLLSKDIFIDQAVNALDLIDNSIKTNYILAVNNKSE